VRIVLPLLVVVALGLLAPWLPGALVWGVLPYAAVAILVLGVGARVFAWGRAPVPFRIPTTCGQQASLPWIAQARWDNPSTAWCAFVRTALEVLCFRSLLRNVAPGRNAEGRLIFTPRPGLWLGGLAFHGSMLVVLLRHLGLFEAQASWLTRLLEATDGFFHAGTPTLHATALILLLALTYLLFRRLLSPTLRYLSLAADYLPLFLLLGVATSGLLLRHIFRTDLVAVRDWAISLLVFQPVLPPSPGWLLPVHVTLAAALAAIFPFSKMVHAAGILMSPTRNLANDSRRVRHANPWLEPAHYRTYAEYEDEFRERMRQAGLPLEKEAP
jgi:nitrate reductase gamma subunit